jgi:hypothetical protein
MRRWAIAPVFVLAVVTGGYALMHPSRERRPEHRGAMEVTGPPSLAELVSFSERPHPHGLDPDDAPSWSQSWGVLWKGGGRHPVWRGCRHVYNPKLTAYLNAPSHVPLGSGT